MSEQDRSPAGGVPHPDEQPRSEHLNIKVTDNNNEVFFKIKRTTALSKLMNAFCDRQGKNLQSVRFLFDGARVNPTDSPDSVSKSLLLITTPSILRQDISIKKDCHPMAIASYTWHYFSLPYECHSPSL